MNHRTFVSLGLVTVMLVGASILAGCGKGGAGTDGTTSDGATSELSGTIDVQGSDTMLNIATAWSEGFMDENPGVDISVQGGGSGTGIAALINGTVDFADASREMKDEEKTDLEAKGGVAVETPVAIDGIAVVVNPANTVEALTIEQLGKIYRGEITNWKDVGGADKAIVLLSRDSSSGTYEYFKETVVAADDKNAEFAQAAKLLPSTQAIVDETVANDGAIGYVGLGYVTADIKVVAIDGVKASIDTAADGSYPISRYLYMYSNGEPQGVMAAYLDWILGDAGQQVVADEGFVPLP